MFIKTNIHEIIIYIKSEQCTDNAHHQNHNRNEAKRELNLSHLQKRRRRFTWPTFGMVYENYTQTHYVYMFPSVAHYLCCLDMSSKLC